MKLQVLISAMNQSDNEIVSRMNIQTDAIIINQCDRFGYEEFIDNGNLIKKYSFNEIGVGLSRNSALMRAYTDICIFADEDLSYIDGYEEIVKDAFKSNPDADIILFNVLSRNVERPSFRIRKKAKLTLRSVLKYGAVRIAARTNSLKKSNVYFSLLYGGGAKYSAGEDSLFLVECIKKRLNVFTDPRIIGYVKQEDSSWFKGYTDKYFYDKGIWLANAFPNTKYLFAIYYSIKLRKLTKKTYIKIYKLISSGIHDFNERI